MQLHEAGYLDSLRAYQQTKDKSFKNYSVMINHKANYAT